MGLLLHCSQTKSAKYVYVHSNKHSFCKPLKHCSPARGLLKAMSLTIRQQRVYFESTHDSSTFYDITRFLVSPLEGCLTTVFTETVFEKPKVSKKGSLFSSQSSCDLKMNTLKKKINWFYWLPFRSKGKTDRSWSCEGTSYGDPELSIYSGNACILFRNLCTRNEHKLTVT